ncbi:MAG: hypothetical protein V1792_27470 [Pseudomonadota bacterium]
MTALLLAADHAWALQVHPEPEGLIAHQLAHMFFATTMAVLAYWLQANGFVRERGWRLIQVSCLLFFLWNIDAVAGHWTAVRLPNDLFVGDPGSLSRRIMPGESFLVLPYLMLHFDHFFCVPAILCLLLGIRSLYLNVVNGDGAEG